jgi:glycosyltransferase involved in cell wall biosynthesis
MYTINISKMLSERGHKVTLLCPKESFLEKEANNLNLNVESLLGNSPLIFSSSYKIYQLLKSGRFDVIHTQLSHDLWTLVPTMKLGRCNTKFLLTKHMASSIKKKDFLHRFLYKRLDGILCISNFIRQNVIETCPVEPQKVHTLWNAIDVDRYKPEIYNKTDVRKDLGIDKEALVVGLAGRFTKMKGHKEFLYAAKQIKDETDLNVLFLIVGDASYGEESYGEEIRALVTELQLDSKVIFTGFSKDIPRMMSAIDILTFPSHKESFGYILLEAMAMRLPVVASNSGAVPEIVIEGETGFLVPPKDANPLTEKIMILLQDQSLRENFGLAGRKRVEKYFLIDSFIEALEGHYKIS